MPTREAERRWSAAVEEALFTPPPLTDDYCPLEALHSVATLLGGLREPANEVEREIESNTPADAIVRFVLASARDDQSPGEAAEYAFSRGWPSSSDRSLRLESLTMPAEPSSCQSEPIWAAPRLQSWAEAQTSGWPRPQAWPCSQGGFFDPGFADCRPACMPDRPIVSGDGTATCRLLIRSPEIDCATERGWLDPLDSDGVRRARFVEEVPGRFFRVCEIVQLQGAELEACRHDLNCTGCSAGWCATEVPELLDECRSPDIPTPFRFVGGSRYAPLARVEVTCNYSEANARMRRFE